MSRAEVGSWLYAWPGRGRLMGRLGLSVCGGSPPSVGWCRGREGGVCPCVGVGGLIPDRPGFAIR